MCPSSENTYIETHSRGLVSPCNDLACISLPISSIFNALIRNGNVPKLWKSADILPLGKISQPKSIETDLRPISLTAVVSKILESFVFSWLETHGFMSHLMVSWFNL